MTVQKILTALRNSGGSMQYVDLMNCGLTDPKHDPSADKLRLERMIEDGYIKGNLDAYERITLTTSGGQYLDEIEQRAEDKRDDRAYQARREDRALKIGLVTGIISAVVSVVFSALVNFLFQRFG